jgi:HAD superfamily hydrolase (TIGR01509 family)
MEKFTHILLDFDGVVADTESVFDRFDCNLINEVLTRAGYEADLTPERMRYYAGIPSEEKLEIIAREKNFDVSAYIQEFIAKRNYSRANLFLDYKVKVARGFESFMEKHKEQCTLVTNKNREKLGWDIEALGLKEYFTRIVCLEPSMKRKPAPDLLLRALEISEANAATTGYVGDNELDMKAALAAGVHPLGFVIEGLDIKQERVRELFKAGASAVFDDFTDLQSRMLEP